MLQIRYGAPTDLPFVRAWAPYSAWETLSDEQRAVTQTDRLARTAQAQVSAVLADPQSALLLIAELGPRPAGYLLGGAAPDGATGEVNGHVLDLFVVPPLRRQGIGRALTRAAEAHFTRMGLPKLKVFTGLHNAAAVHMASAGGYQPEGLIGLRQW